MLRGWLFLSVLLFGLVAGQMAVAQDAPDVRIASFNIQNLGPKKAKNATIMRYLAAIIRHFDIVAVQEVSDVSERVPGLLLAEVNATGKAYGMLLSPRSGRQPDDRASQEQYAFYFDTARIEPLGDAGLFDDSAADLFQREPYTARFALKGSTLTFAVTQIHTRPESAVTEIDALFQVHGDVARRYPGEANQIILGDFNAGCSYASADDLRGLRLRGAQFRWIVPDDADTTVSPGTHCAYDRIVVTRELASRFGQWGVARWFDDKRISDHWPVWVSLKPGLP